MEINFPELMKKKSDEGLRVYLTDMDKYVPDAIYAAVNEMKSRGKVFTVEEWQALEEKIQKKLAGNGQQEADLWGATPVSSAHPEMYTPRAVWGFSAFFSVIFGAVLLANNIEERDGKQTVIAFGIFFTAASIFFLSLLPVTNTLLTLVVNSGGGYLMVALFWNKHIGKHTPYRAKAIWKPLIISLLITIPIAWAAIYVDRLDG